jgi:hypothetical protein
VLHAQAVFRKPREVKKMISSRFGGKAIRMGMLGTAALAAYLLLIRPRHLRWGATAEEVARVMPGDDFLPDPDLTATRGVTVRRRPANVWPWLAQLGQGRGGFYSYDVLENVVGCDIHSVSRVVPEWQEIRVGDQVRLHPEVGLAVVMADPGHALVLRGGVPMGRTQPPYDFIWTFALQGRSDGTTRLLVRERYRYTRWWAPLLVEPVEMISFVMSLKMMGGIRDRAERWSNAAEQQREVGRAVARTYRAGSGRRARRQVHPVQFTTPQRATSG